MQYMLDTNICIYIIKKKPPHVLERLQSFAIEDVAISSITLAEMEYGIKKSSKPRQNHDALYEFVTPLEILNFDDRAACHYGEIRAHLEAKGNLIGSMDLLIAAHARSLTCTLATNNVKEFKRVPGLLVENWV